MDIKKFLFIRHGRTRSNIERRYIGDVNEPLCEEGVAELKALSIGEILPRAGRIITGAAIRCRQTAEILFPNAEYELCSFNEIDFGVFKGKNADDLFGNKDYENWLGTGCMGNIPGGDSVSEFKRRCVNEFESIAPTCKNETTALIIHGGNIMAVLEKFAFPKKSFYDYHVQNCGFFLCRYENGRLYTERSGGKA